MLSRIKRSPRRYAIIAGVVVLIIAGYMLQARTTIEVRDDGYTILCWHAHFRDHGKSDGTEFTFIRHYHRDSYVPSCEDDPTRSWQMPEGRGYQRFDVRQVEPSDRWPEEPGIYVFVKKWGRRDNLIYVGHTTNLKETLSNPAGHEEWSCMNEKGPPNRIYARQHRPRNKANRHDATLLIETFAPPCNQN